MMKKKKTFPDLNKDGKITYADILAGKGAPTAANFKRAAKTAKKRKG
jgi:hypothetical protein